MDINETMKAASDYMKIIESHDSSEVDIRWSLISIGYSLMAISKQLESISENLRMGPEYTPPTYKVVSVKDGKTKTYP